MPIKEKLEKHIKKYMHATDPQAAFTDDHFKDKQEGINNEFYILLDYTKGK